MPFNWDVKRFGGSVSGPRFGGFQEQYLRLSCPKGEPGSAPNPPNSVMFVSCFLFLGHLFPRHLFDHLDAILKAFSRKNTSKRGILLLRERRSGLISETLVRSWTTSGQILVSRTCTPRSLALSSNCACGATSP